ncbi:replication protein [Amphibacillus marinus]|nr:replication protein [Amphibacillus marinus]
MANVQVENGFTQIANEILENMAKIKLSPTQYRILFVIWRYTYGFKRIEHKLSLSFLSEATGCDKRNIQRELTSLEDRKIIKQSVANGSCRTIAFVKDHDLWDSTIGESNKGSRSVVDSTIGKTNEGRVGESNKGTFGETDNQEIKNLNKNLNKNTRKRVYEETSIYFKLAKYLFERIQENNPNHKKPNFQNWSNDIRLMMEVDKRNEKDIKRLMQWVQQDDFEMINVSSPGKLRKRYDQLFLKSSKDKNFRTLSQVDPRDKEIAFQNWIIEGNDPDKFDWSD